MEGLLGPVSWLQSVVHTLLHGLAFRWTITIAPAARVAAATRRMRALPAGSLHGLQ